MRMEAELVTAGLRRSVVGRRRASEKRWLFGSLDLALRGTGMHGRGRRNALALQVSRIDLDFPDLPVPFDDFTILYLSDIHVGQMEGIIEAATAAVSELDVDLAVIGGDVQTWGGPAPEELEQQMRPLLSGISARHGIAAVLGNHDSHVVADMLASLGVRVLLNETWSVLRDGAAIHLVGTDDVHSYYTEAAPSALREAPTGFRIALVHSVELAAIAVEAGYALYLAGHTHGGQICLPGGKPVMTGLDSHRHLATGWWRLGGLQGFTSRGIGVGQPPVRFNCPGEIAVIRLRRRTRP